ncbi:hypothetical protein TI39_contig385g00012 [Zymoseptoria brevis]|uniref:non-specific serine/threonine protein kinase n=1 Tax=Zymoseptoria brevis TaxID=1047168 RepID=A0A0F4GN55_9PEZI|nr:hypothetical protein TI39_contig385g00012 [Zymoseptoria brevis]
MASEPTPQYDALLAFRSAFISAMARIPTRDNALVSYVRPPLPPLPPPPPPPLPGADITMTPGGLVWPNAPQSTQPEDAPPQELYSDYGAFEQSSFAVTGTATDDRYEQFLAGDISGSTEVNHDQVWQGMQFIAADNDTMVGLFGQPDANGNLGRRIAVKDSQCNPMTWFMPLYWAGAYDERGVRDYSGPIDHKESMETYVHRKVSALAPGCIVAYEGRTFVDTEQWRTRFFMEYCPHRSLESLINEYRRVTNFRDVPVTEYARPDSDQTHTIPNVLIPEPFIWYCFSNLAKAALIMEQGSIQTPVVGWKPIIHRDIKPANIWLQDPPNGRNAQWPLYPEPKLGDFGIAVESGPNDPPANNPRAFRGLGTKGHFAPEQLHWIRRDDFRVSDYPRLSAKTNVWGIGSVIYALVYRCNEIKTPNFDFET